MQILRITIFLLASCLALNAQSKKAVKTMQKAREMVRDEKLADALEELQELTNDEPNYIEAQLFLADLYRKTELYDSALVVYERIQDQDPPFYVSLFYGRLLFNRQRYAEAKEQLQSYAASPNANSRYLKEVERLIESCDFAQKAQTDPQPYNPQNLGPKVNSDQLEYFPSISADGNTLVFTYRNLRGDDLDEDFWFTGRDSSGAEWQKAKYMQGALNSDGNEGAQALTADGKVLFFAACERPKGFGSCDIYVSFRQANGLWGPAQNLGGAINSSLWESQPSISPDGRTLYFVRGGSSVSKNIDIYYSNFGPRGWSKAKPLEGAVNTSGQDVSPFIYFDNESLYFSSNGHPGMGDLDFFVSRKQPDGSWGTPENLGHPINTAYQEFSLIVAPDGKTGYFSSDALADGFGLLDLYQFQLPEQSQSRPIAYVQGTVTDQKTGSSLRAQLKFEDLNDSTRLFDQTSNEQGRFYAVLPARSDYGLSVAKPGYLFYSKNFALRDQNREEALELQVKLVPIEVGRSVKLENVFFDFDSYNLQATSAAEIKEIARFMKQNPTVKIELQGHTDNQGSESYNLKLSQERAEAVRSALIKLGVSASRMVSKGFGASKPVADNKSEEGRALNRRTTLVITER